MRIDHSNHSHQATTLARTACRTALGRAQRAVMDDADNADDLVHAFAIVAGITVTSAYNLVDNSRIQQSAHTAPVAPRHWLAVGDVVMVRLSDAAPMEATVVGVEEHAYSEYLVSSGYPEFWLYVTVRTTRSGRLYRVADKEITKA